MNHYDTGLSKHIEEEVREKMKRYWQVYKPSLESMMLSHDAQYLAENEQNELLSYLPAYKDLNVLELGAGIGRFTSRFALIASHVTAVDFMEAYIKENEESNGHFENITFKCADVTKLDFPPGSFDLIFSNWLLMYLTNSEIEGLMESVLRWLKPNGYFFFRESCYHQSGNVARAENPTKYRTPLQYINMLNKASNNIYTYNLKSAKSVLTYIYYHGNPNQLCLLAQKNKTSQKEVSVIEKMNMYNLSTSEDRLKIGSILDSSAGEHLVKNLGVKLGLRGGHRVLNLGCGVGAIPTLLAKEYEVFVHGIDPSPLNIHYAIEAQGKLDLNARKKIQYESTDWMESDLSTEAYEVVICFDVLLSKNESMKLIKKAQTWLKHSGKLVVIIFLLNKALANSTEIENEEDFLEEKDLECYLKSLSMTLQELKPESEVALKRLRSLDSEFEGYLKRSERSRDDVIPKEFLQDMKRKIKLLETKEIKASRLIAMK